MTEPTYAPMTPTQRAELLGVPLSQRLRPDLSVAVPKKLVPKAEAVFYKESLYWDGGSACRLGHVAARQVANSRICTDCQRLKAGLDPIYPKSRAQVFYPESRVARAKAGKAPAPAAPVALAPPRPLEPSKKEQDFLAALDELRDFDAAAKSVGMTRGQVEARASVDPVFKSALTDLCERRLIPQTRAPDPKAFKWTAAIEKQLVKRFIDLGLLETARTELGVSASDYQEHLRDCDEFRKMIETARPMARETLRERAAALADRGKPELLKFLEDGLDEDDDFMTLRNGQRAPKYMNADRACEELATLLGNARKALAQRTALGQTKRTADAVTDSNEDLL